MTEPGPHLSNTLLRRGLLGNTPALPSRSDESFVDFICDARNVLVMEKRTSLSDRGNTQAKAAGVRINHDSESVAQVREVIADDAPLATFMRLKRTFQEVYKDRQIASLNTQRDDWLRALTDAEQQGPGSVTFDPDFPMPDYAKVEIHIQPRGYAGDDLAGLFYDCGTQVFFGGANAADAYHASLAKQTALPQDGKAERIVEIGGSVGQLACELKKLHPDAEVWGTDISAAMVRYSHWRAIQQNVDVHFAQMASEALDFPDNHVDVIVAHILFHEIPAPVIDKTLAEAFRVLRPGGTFVLMDFATQESARETNEDTVAREGALGYGGGYGGVYGLMDAADNGEPYSPGLVTMNVEQHIKDAGFNMRPIENPGRTVVRVCDKG